MNILQVMGCESNQYSSMERYLVRKAFLASQGDHKLFVAYDNTPTSVGFINEYNESGGVLLKLKCEGFLDWSFYRKFRTIIRENNIDVIHSYFTPTCHFVMIASFLLGIRKRFRTSANLPHTLFESARKPSAFARILFVLEQRVLSLFPKKIICRSNGVRNEFEKMGIPSHKVVVASGGTDINKYIRDNSKNALLREQYNLDLKTKVVSTICRLDPVKGVDILIRAAARLVRYREDVKFMVIGDGLERDKLTALSCELGVDANMIFAGHHEDVSPFLNITDLFVLPSYAEGMSNSILEAMACELPVIVSDILPNLEIFEAAHQLHCEIGDTFEAGDDEKLAEKLDRFLQRKDLVDLGRQSRRVVQEFFSLDARIEKEFSAYESVQA